MYAGVVKMRRGETAKYVQLLTNMGDLYRAFELFSGRLAKQYAPQPRTHTLMGTQTSFEQSCLVTSVAAEAVLYRVCIVRLSCNFAVPDTP